MTRASPHHHARAFTLIETLVALVIIGVLASILLSAFAGARRAARATLNLAQLRQHASIINTYTHDFREAFPLITKPGWFSTTLRAGGMSFGHFSYFDANEAWHIALRDRYYNSDLRTGVFRSPAAVVGMENEVYRYPCSFIAAPAYWNRLTRRGPVQWMATTQSGVGSPARKALLVDPATWSPTLSPNSWLSTPLPMAFVDTSAVDLALNRLAEGYPFGDGVQFREQGAVHFTDFPWGLHTLDGVRGSDRTP